MKEPKRGEGVGAGMVCVRAANRRRRELLPMVLASLVLLVGACGCRTGSKTRRAGSTAAASNGTQSPSGTNAELEERLRHIAAVCEIDVTQSLVACRDGEQRKLANDYRTNVRSRTEAVGALARALGDETPGVPTIVANLLYSDAFRTAWGDAAPGSVAATDADALLASVLALPEKQSEQALPAAVHAEMLAGRGPNLVAALDKAANPKLIVVAASQLMTHGRLAAFPEVQKLSREGNAEQAAAALESPLGMPAWTDAERAALCPWAATLLSDSRAGVASAAASVVDACGGEAVDRLLGAREGELLHGHFTAASLADLRTLCSSKRRERPVPPSAAQCERTRKLLEAVEGSQDFDVTLRNGALVALAYQFPDAETLALARSIEKGSAGVLADTAQRIIRRQTRAAGADSATQLPVAFSPPPRD